MTYPTLEDKTAIINNTVEVCHACGIAEPKVAPVAAVEVVNPKMPCTVDADELTKLNAEGKITGCIIDGYFLWTWRSTALPLHTKAAQTERLPETQMSSSSRTSIPETLYTRY